MTNRFEERLKRLEDLQAIQQLFIDYGKYLDAGDLDAYVSLFTEDGELRLGPMGNTKGREAIRAVMEKALGGLIGHSFHLISSPIISLDGDSATSEVMWTVIQRGKDGSPIVPMVGRHRDNLIRSQDGAWRFSRRQGFVDIPSKLS